jgi:phospholipase C
MPKQEKGTRTACPIPYQLYADGAMNTDKKAFEITLEARNDIFGKQSVGSPFIVYAPGKYKEEDVRVWNYAVSAGDKLQDQWPVEDFGAQQYHLQVYGPNGFMREYNGNSADPGIQVWCGYQLDKNQKPTGNIELKIKNTDKDKKYTIVVKDNAYKGKTQTKTLDSADSKGSESTIVVDLQKSFSWYDFSLTVSGNDIFAKRYTGHVETGRESQSDPLMGGLIG